MIGDGLYECGSCGHTWPTGDALEDVGAVACEICGIFDTFVREVRDGYQRGVEHSLARSQNPWAANEVDADIARHMAELHRQSAVAKERSRGQENKRLMGMTRRMVRSYLTKFGRPDQDG